ncbi:MAG: hypothetical protein RLZZ501_2260 [Pseudomonadota bacterium]|jgi:phage-related baseplate assembly protein
MSRFAAIDLSSLPAPDVVETIEYETILAALKADFLARYSDYTAGDLESDPAAKILETAAYRETILRQRVNDAARARNLVFAEGDDLAALGADAGVYRLTLTAATADTAEVLEADEDFKRRIQLAPESLTTAGPSGSYVFAALTAGETPVSITVASPASGTVTLTYTYDESTSLSARIKHATADMGDEAGTVLVTLLGRSGAGAVDDDTIATVAANLSSKSVRPLCDAVTVQAAEILSYRVVAVLEIYDGLDADTIKAAALAAWEKVAAARHALGESVTDSVVKGALHVSGVKTVTLDDWSDVVCDDSQAPYCTGTTLSTTAETA